MTTTQLRAWRNGWALHKNMKNKNKINSRIEIDDPAKVKQLEAVRKQIKPLPGLKPFLEMLIEAGLEAISKKQESANRQ